MCCAPPLAPPTPLYCRALPAGLPPPPLLFPPRLSVDVDPRRLRGGYPSLVPPPHASGLPSTTHSGTSVACAAPSAVNAATDDSSSFAASAATATTAASAASVTSAADAPPRPPPPHPRHRRPSPPPPRRASFARGQLPVPRRCSSLSLTTYVQLLCMLWWPMACCVTGGSFQLPGDCLLSPCGSAVLFLHRPLISRDVSHAPVRA